MLRQLYIRNFTLIDELDVTFNTGFSVVTGETGAGKSIILGAVGLLLGSRADAKQIKMGADKCIIEAHFDLSQYDLQSLFDENDIDYDAHDCIIRREVSSNGKSRAFVNDTPVGLNILKELGGYLVDIHSQHQNLLLQKEDFQLGVLDVIAADGNLKDEYQSSFKAYKKAEKQLQQLREKIESTKENEDYLRFQVNEIERAHLEEGMQEELEQESETMAHAEEIKSGLYLVDNLLNGDDTGIVQQLKQASQSLQSIEKVYPKVKGLCDRINSSYIELKDISEEISGGIDDIDFDPAKQEEINDKLDTLYSLQQKFHASTVRGLLDTLEDFRQQLHDIEYGEEELAVLEKERDRLMTYAESLATKLTMSRRHAAGQVEREMQNRLIPLGMPNIRFKVELLEKSLAEDGADKVQFLFSANKSTALQPVAQIASGGEISRVMLSLKAMISNAVKLPTIIFDEIDTGVSGRVAEQMAQIMYEMGETGRQVISITHLPQIAAMGTTHYRVSKQETQQGTTSHMVSLSQKERIMEIAQMLSGNDISDAAIENAKSLLKISI